MREIREGWEALENFGKVGGTLLELSDAQGFGKGNFGKVQGSELWEWLFGKVQGRDF